MPPVPELYRLFLVAGMVGHKALWEVLRVRAERTLGRPAVSRPPGPPVRVLKAGKATFLVFLIAQALFLDVLPISSDPAGIRAAGLVVFSAGLALAIAGRLQLGVNWANLEDYSVLPEQRLVRHGVYRFVRHPIYGGDLLLLAGLQLAVNSWLVLLVLPIAAVVVRQARREEQILARAFPDYGEYRKRTRMLVPFLV
jgi:protein-S-isoprenylcysteine O-methyltransferase Ste14